MQVPHVASPWVLVEQRVLVLRPVKWQLEVALANRPVLVPGIAQMVMLPPAAPPVGRALAFLGVASPSSHCNRLSIGSPWTLA